MDPVVQINPFKITLDTMLILQDLDDQIRQLSRKRRELQTQLDVSQAAVEAASASQSELKKNFEEEKKKRGLYELDVKVREEEILKHNAQLNDCKTNAAYAAMLSEIKASKDAKRELEEKIIRLMENEETMQAQFEEQSAAMQEKVAQVKMEQEKIQKEASAFDSEEASLAEKRAHTVENLDPAHREMYERRAVHRPRVITLMQKNQVCGSCSMKVPAHQVNELKKMKQFIYCQSCGVILVIGSPS